MGKIYGNRLQLFGIIPLYMVTTVMGAIITMDGHIGDWALMFILAEKGAAADIISKEEGDMPSLIFREIGTGT
ncbi:MAG: hypothetical protein PHQ47_03535 [Candidatus Portnoybacteria bacterium]|nr:hypothetical protein [Candidatus Portnoybacteria bacterium]